MTARTRESFDFIFAEKKRFGLMARHLNSRATKSRERCSR